MSSAGASQPVRAARAARCFAAIDSYGGRLMDDRPGRTLATFDGPARAIHGASGVREAIGELGLSMRAGLQARARTCGQP